MAPTPQSEIWQISFSFLSHLPPPTRLWVRAPQTSEIFPGAAMMMICPMAEASSQMNSCFETRFASVRTFSLTRSASVRRLGRFPARHMVATIKVTFSTNARRRRCRCGTKRRKTSNPAELAWTNAAQSWIAPDPQLPLGQRLSQKLEDDTLCAKVVRVGTQKLKTRDP